MPPVPAHTSPQLPQRHLLTPSCHAVATDTIRKGINMHKCPLAGGPLTRGQGPALTSWPHPVDSYLNEWLGTSATSGRGRDPAVPAPPPLLFERAAVQGEMFCFLNDSVLKDWLFFGFCPFLETFSSFEPPLIRPPPCGQRGRGSLERQERGAAAGALGRGPWQDLPAGVHRAGGLHICM